MGAGFLALGFLWDLVDLDWVVDALAWGLDCVALALGVGFVAAWELGLLGVFLELGELARVILELAQTHNRQNKRNLRISLF